MRATKTSGTLPLISLLSLSLIPVTFALPALAAGSSDAADTLTKIHETDQKEIDMGKLAEKNGKAKDVINFGKMLVKDHSEADKKVMALAKKQKVDLGSVPSTTVDNEMSKMAEGGDFDKHFAQKMLDDHTKDIAELTSVHDRTTDEQLKKLIANLLPTLKKHQETAQKILDASKK